MSYDGDAAAKKLNYDLSFAAPEVWPLKIREALQRAYEQGAADWAEWRGNTPPDEVDDLETIELRTLEYQLSQFPGKVSEVYIEMPSGMKRKIVTAVVGDFGLVKIVAGVEYTPEPY